MTNGNDDIVRLETSPRLSRVVKHGPYVFLSGVTAPDDSGDVKAQTRTALAKLDGYLAQAGTDKSRLLSVQIWLADIDRDLAGMNEVWNAWTPPDGAPARACGESKLNNAQTLVEFIAIAVAGS